MDTIYIFFLTLILVLTGGLVIYLLIKRPYFLKKYWKYIAGGAGTLVGALGVAWLIGLIRSRGADTDPEIERKEKGFRKELKTSRLEMEAELGQAREKEQAVKEELEVIDKIEDEKERLTALAALYNKRRRR